MTQFFAHSGNNFTPQTYSEHVGNVYNTAVANANKAVSKSSLSQLEKDFFVDIVSIASLYHDLGKLDDSSQIILSSETTLLGSHLMNHVDAGVAYCLKEYDASKNLAYLFAAYLIHAHHIGLQDFEWLFSTKAGSMFGGVNYGYNIDTLRDTIIMSQVDSILPLYLSRHNISTDIRYMPKTNETNKFPLTFFDLRMALSCLVDADHSDTAFFYSQGVCQTQYIPLEAEEYLISLNQFVTTLPQKGTKERHNLRKLLFKIANEFRINKKSFHLMEAPVGTGKTYSELAACLKIAKEKQLNRLVTVLPYILTIDQTAKAYKDALRIDGESLDKSQDSLTSTTVDSIKSHNTIVNTIHSKVEFDDLMLRQYSKTFQYPINITTAVLFFESLASNRPSALRKLHLFANSVINLDEFHTMTPHHLWGLNLMLLQGLSRYNTHILFGSGSSVYYWDMFSSNIEVNKLLNGENYKKMYKAEKKRVICVPKTDEFTDLVSFYKFVLSKNTKSKLIVCNTVKNALIIATDLIHLTKDKVYHLSNALNNQDKTKILEKVKEALINGERVILVATSLIECGII